jgi:flagellar hook protein FlgE
MMRALFAGVSGLANNQVKMDIIGNNIANINTTGFKTSRINFSEELSQVLQGARESRSGGLTNALLVGLGVRGGAIERDFAQGILQTTGRSTDLGLEGEGFFVLSDGTSQLYTRAGNFHFDGNGRLVNQSGLTVQGWTADTDGELAQTAELGNIVFDASVISPAIATTNVAISGNLDATAEPVRDEWTASQTFTVNNPAPGTPVDAADTATTDLNALEQTTTPLVDGDVINITGTAVSGAVISSTFTYGAGNDGTTVQDFMDRIDTIFDADADTEIDVTLESGRIVVRNFNFGESDLTITLTQAAGNTGEISMPGFINTAQGYTPRASTSVEIFDSLGSKHTLNIVFTKTDATGEWDFAMSFPGDESITAGATGILTFGSDGSIATIQYDGGQNSLVVDLSSDTGAENMSVNLDFENATGFSGLTQFSGASSVTIPYQDGQAHGSLSSFSIDESGRIVGSFTNGRSRLIAQMAMAKINNPEGLLHVGSNVYQTSGSTGIPAIGKASEDFPTTMLAGTLEASNVDLAEEFTEMIIAQRAFQANARVITVSDQFLSEVTQLKR